MNYAKNYRVFKRIILVFAIISVISLALQNMSNPQKQATSSIPRSQMAVNETPTQVVTSNTNSLGNMTMTLLQTQNYPNSTIVSNILQDQINRYINVTELSYANQYILFNQTVTPASLNTETLVSSSPVYNLTIRLNELYQISYNNYSQVHIFGFRPSLQPARFHAVYLNNSLLSPSNYIVNYTQSGLNQYNTSCYYDFTSLFQSHQNGTFLLTFQYDYDFPLTYWTVTQTTLDQYLTQNPQTLGVEYSENVSIGNIETPMNVTASFNVTLPDPSVIYGDTFNQFGSRATLPSDYRDYGNNIFQIFSVDTNFTTVALGFNFWANFTVQLNNAIFDDNCCADELVSGISLRQRTYEVSVISGPPDLNLMNFCLNDTSIYYSDYFGLGSFSSALGRSPNIENMNLSLPENPNNTTKYVDGVSLLGSNNGLYYLATGETDFLTLTYNASRTLDCILTDNITNPLQGYQVRFYFGNQLYGSQMTWQGGDPYPTLTTDAQGEVIVPYVPLGNYTLELLDPSGNFVLNTTVSSGVSLNFISTPVVHFPTLILVYGGIFGAILLIGIAVYRKNSQTPQKM